MNKVYEYKMAMISIFEEKYGWSEFQAQKAIKDYDFQSAIKKCNYVVEKITLFCPTLQMSWTVLQSKHSSIHYAERRVLL